MHYEAFVWCNYLGVGDESEDRIAVIMQDVIRDIHLAEILHRCTMLVSGVLIWRCKSQDRALLAVIMGVVNIAPL